MATNKDCQVAAATVEAMSRRDSLRPYRGGRTSCEDRLKVKCSGACWSWADQADPRACDAGVLAMKVGEAALGIRWIVGCRRLAFEIKRRGLRSRTASDVTRERTRPVF